MKKTRLACAIFAALYSSNWVVAQESVEDENARPQIETIEVTATKRPQNIQETPLAVQAMSAEDMKDQNIGNFDDFARYAPNVTLGGRGPGQSDVFIRGLSIQPIAVMLSGAQGTMPNVALYIDEQPVTAPGRNLDVYATDLERIEVLPGPQGTLFGASSQAGTIRYITNKPRFDGFEAGLTLELSTTKSGDQSDSVEGFINIPISDELAFRAAIYNVNLGGYIDNVAGEFTLDPAINTESAVDLGPDAIYQSANNAGLVAENFNDSFYSGGRLGLMYEQDTWSLLVQHAVQSLGADGVFDYDPAVGDLQVQRYFPDDLDDEFSQTSWTLEKRFEMLDLIYTGAFLDRKVEQSIDYTGYNNTGAFIAYYTCTYTNPDYIVNYNISPDVITDVRECRNPIKGFTGKQEHRRFTQEVRITTDPDKPLRIVAGVFYDDFEIETQDDYHYLAAVELGFAPNAPISGSVQVNSATRPPGVTFFNDVTRTEEQIAFFTEISYDLTDDLTATLGLRWYDIESDFAGSSNFADGIFQGSVNTDRGRDYDVSGGHTDEPLKSDDFIPKLNLSYQGIEDVLLYATYSEGFRPGGFNRGGGIPSNNSAFPDVFVTYSTDDVVNWEFGWKSLLLDNSVKFNGNLYFIEWTDMQVSRFDPVNVSILTFIENAADSEITGLELDLAWAATDNLTVLGAVSYNSSELTGLSAQIVEMAPVGSELPLTPKMQGNLRLRYDWEIDEYLANVQFGWQFASSAYSSIVAEEREKQDGYNMVNLSIGFESENWGVKLFADNLTDERPELFINLMDDIKRISTTRPRTIGIKFTYNYF